MTREHVDEWVFTKEQDRMIRYIRDFAEQLLGVPHEDITVESYSVDNDGLFGATVSIPYMDGFKTEHIHE